MDFGQLWAEFVGSLPDTRPEAMQMLETAFANPWARAAGLILIVYVTIRIIAAVYSGEKNGAELGPVAIRPHVSGRFDRQTVRIPHSLIPMAMDGVAADCKIYYAFTDANGKRRRRLVKTIDGARLSVSPVNIPRINDIIFGQEVPSVPREFVCFPLELETPTEPVPATPDDAREYAALHKILERWREDDDAITISVAPDVKEEIAANKIEFIEERVAKQKKAKSGAFSKAFAFPNLRKNRPNVIGSYYIKFEFSHEPLFVLTRHPDRDLKMTAWLTVLTSMFAMIMEAWPNGQQPPMAPPIAAVERQAPEARGATPRPPVVPPT